MNIKTADVMSGGVCTNPKLACLEVNPETRIIRIKTQEEIPTGMPYTFELVGLDNPRSLNPTAGFHLTTYDVDGTSPIDTGYDVNTVMNEISAITSFTVEP